MQKLFNHLSLAFVAAALLLVSGCETDSVDPTEDAVTEESSGEGTITFLDEEESFAEGDSNTRVSNINHTRTFNDLTWNTNDQRRKYTGWGQFYGCTNMSNVGPIQAPGGSRLQPFKYHYKAETIVRQGGSVTLRVFPTVHLNNNCAPTSVERSFVAYLSVEKKSSSGNWLVRYRSNGKPSYMSTSWKTGPGRTGYREVGRSRQFTITDRNGILPKGTIGDCYPNYGNVSITDQPLQGIVNYTCYYYYPGILHAVVQPAPVKELTLFFKQWGSGEYRVKAIVTTQGKEKRLTTTFNYTR